MTLLQRDREKYAEGRAEGIVLITEAFKRLVAGESKEMLIDSGVPEDIVNEAEKLLNETVNK